MNGSGGNESAPQGWYPDPASSDQLRYWDGISWTPHTAPAVTLTPPVQPPPAPRVVIPRVEARNPSKRSHKGFLARALWNIYAMPVTMFLLVMSAVALGNGLVYVADAVISLPQFIALHLYIWDKHVLRPVVWRIYAVTFLVWQLAFGFYIEPMVSNRPLDVGVLVPFGVQLPMLIAVFLYAFGKWDATPAATRRQPQEKGRALPVLLTTLGCLVLVPALVFGYFARDQIPAMLRNLIVPPAPVWEVSVPAPKTVSTGPTRPRLSAQESTQLRALSRSRDFASLNTSLAAIQRSFERSAAFDCRVRAAFDCASIGADEESLKAWVVNDPSHYAPYMARARYQYLAGGAARGTDWARKTTDEQFRQMRMHFAEAEEDIDAALKRNPNLVDAYCLRIDIANVNGDKANEEAAIKEALARFPHSYVVYSRILSAKRPRWGGSYETMERFAKKAVAENPGDRAMVTLFGQIYADQANMAVIDSRYDRALELYLKASAYGETAALLDERGWAYFWEGDDDKAFADASQCIAWDATNDSAYKLRAAVYLGQRNARLAEKDIAMAEALAPGDPYVAKLRARAALLGK